MTAAECAETAVTAVEQLLPALAAGLKNNASQPGGRQASKATKV